MSSEPVFHTVWPLGKKAYPDTTPRERVKDLSGKVVGELWDYVFRGEEIFPILRDQLKAKYPGIKFVNYDTFGNVHGPRQRELVAGIPALLEQHKVDAVISGVGA
jgi:hypothetical protein